MSKAITYKKQDPQLYLNLGSMNFPSKLLVIVAIFLISSITFYYLCCAPYIEERDQLLADQETLKSSNDSLMLSNKNKIMFMGQIFEPLLVVDSYSTKFLPHANDISRFIQMISEYATQGGLSVDNLAPNLPGQIKNSYAEIPFTLTVTGEYTNLVSFLYNISMLDRIINIESIEIGGDRNAGSPVLNKTRSSMVVTAVLGGSIYRKLSLEELLELIKKENKK